MAFKRHEERIKRNRDLTRESVQHFTDTTIHDLIRRAQHLESDAFPSSTTGDGTGSRSANLLTQVEAQANKELFGRPVYDNVGAAIRAIDGEFSKMALASKTAQHALAFIEHVWEKAKDANAITLDNCGECEKPILERTKRLDGTAYHHPEDQQGEKDGRCWWKAYNRTRGRRAS